MANPKRKAESDSKPPHLLWWSVGCVMLNLAANVTINKYGSTWPDWLILLLWILPLIPFGIWAFLREDSLLSKSWLISKWKSHPVSFILIVIMFVGIAANQIPRIARHLRTSGETSVKIPSPPDSVIPLPQYHPPPSGQPTTKKLPQRRAEKPKPSSDKVQKPPPVNVQCDQNKGNCAGVNNGTQQINNAPNGIAIGGGIVTNPTVNNSYGQFPPPGVIPNISICSTKSNALVGEEYINIFTMKTDVPISEPAWWFLFDGPVIDISADADPKPFGYMQAHPAKDKRPNDWERAIGVTVTSIGGMFSQQPWRPGMTITLTVRSKSYVNLLEIHGRSLNESIEENFPRSCTD